MKVYKNKTSKSIIIENRLYFENREDWLDFPNEHWDIDDFINNKMWVEVTDEIEILKYLLSITS